VRLPIGRDWSSVSACGRGSVRHVSPSLSRGRPQGAHLGRSGLVRGAAPDYPYTWIAAVGRPSRVMGCSRRSVAVGRPSKPWAG
jgi:hypothetical protein